jgi:hypothetical protein
MIRFLKAGLSAKEARRVPERKSASRRKMELTFGKCDKDFNQTITLKRGIFVC